LFEQRQWSTASAPALIAGIAWVATASSLSSGNSIVLSIPLWIIGTPMLAAGMSQLLWPGDIRITQTGSLVGVLGAVVSLPYLFVFGPLAGIGLMAASLLSAWGAGHMALQLEPHCEGAPRPRPSAVLAAKVAVDELILGFEQFQSTGFSLDGTIERIIDEVDRMDLFLAERGFLEKPGAYHVAPPDLIDPEIRKLEIAGHTVEVLRFESGYAPADSEPGRARWMGYDPCRDGWAYVLRHQGPPRPWLIATNGYRMGHARIDVGLFERFFKERGGLGLNVLIPVLPLHGPRRIGWHSGSGFLSVDAIDVVHAESQAIWDMRRLLSWAMAQGAPSVGAFGLSLGGYTTALFASITDGLSCAVPGIPVTDLRRVLERHASPHQMRYAQRLGYDYDQIGRVLRVISQLELTPRVPLEGRMIFAATADRLVTPDQVVDLWRHWEEPEIVWYEGTHVSFMGERSVWAGVDRTLSENGLAV
jgi:dienelactone hydrolase